MDFNPYYEEKINQMNKMLDRIQKENNEIQAENVELDKELVLLQNDIETNYTEILNLIEPLKNK